MANTYLTRTSSSTGNRKTWTLSAWVKRAEMGVKHGIFGTYTDANNRLDFAIDGNNRLTMKEKSGGSTIIDFTSTQVFRDISAFYHIVFKVDTTQATEADRIKIYVNGEQITTWLDSTYPSQNYDTLMNVSGRSYLVGQTGGGSNYWVGLMTHLHLTDGYSYEASTFGETDSTSGIWKPKTAPSVTYGTNGLFLKFENSAAMGTDSSGQSNTLTVGGGTLTQNVDTPTNVFPTFNPLAPSSAAQTMTNGNLYLPGPNSNNYWQSVPATMGCTSGKWYWEFKDETDWGSTSDSTRRYGICDLNTIVNTASNSADVRFSDATSAYAYMNASGVRYNGGTISGTTSTHPTFAEGDFIMVAMDLDNNKLYFGKNGTWNDSGDPTSGSTGTGSVADISSTAVWSPYAEIKYGSDTVSANFGQGYFRTTSAGSNTDANGHGKFKYSVPSGYYAICTKNIKEFG